VLRIDHPERAVETLDRAIDLARGGVPGPVVLLTPADVLLEETEQPENRHAEAADLTGTMDFPADRSVPAPQQVARAVDALARATRPVVIAGGGVHRSGAAAALRDFVWEHRIPVATTNMGKGAIDEADELSIGVIGNAMAPRSTTYGMDEIIADADVILIVGARMNENGTDSWKLFPESATYIQIDIDPEELGRNYPAIRLLGDVDATLRQVAVEAQTRDDFQPGRAVDDVIRRIAELRAAAQATLAEKVDLDQSPIRPERIVRDLADAVPEDAILVADASYSTIWLSNYFRAVGGRHAFVEPRGMAGLGWGFPMAIGAKVAHPDREVVCITGDGGFGHVWQEMETLARMDRKVTIVLLDNGILGFQKHAEIAKYRDTTTATRFADVDHAGIARSAGIDALDVSDPAELAPAFAKALDSPTSTLIVVKTDPRAYPPITSFGDITEEV
jgi:acetolactate synthase-1/2/3 large subunit